MTPNTVPGYVPYLIVAVVAFAIYRRIRGNFGRQAWNPMRSMVRLVLLALVMGMLVMAAVFLPGAAPMIGAGAVVGVALGLLALRLVHIEMHEGRPTYVPNPWIGGALSALLIGRIGWRYLNGDFASHAAAPTTSSPLTMALGAMVIAFYLVQGIGLMRRMKHLVAAPIAA